MICSIAWPAPARRPSRGFASATLSTMSAKQTISNDELMRMAHQAQQLELEGRYSHVLELGQQMVKVRPDWAIAHYFVGSGQCGCGMLDEANRALKKAIDRDPKAGMYTRQAEVLNRLGQREDAIEAARSAVKLSPDDPEIFVPAAMTIWLAGDPKAAHALLSDAIERGVTSPKLRSVYATVCAEIGPVEDAIGQLEELLREHDDGQSLPRMQRSTTLFHLAKLLDKVGRYDEAFRAAQISGGLRETGYNPGARSAECEQRLAAWNNDSYSQIATSRAKSEKPVFIIGMPRSGTSLVEQIVASHPQAFGCGELLDTYRAARDLSEPNEYQKDRSQIALQLKPAELDRAARKSLKSMERSAKTEKGRVDRLTDKQPNNYEFVGIISKMFPGARFIHCKRNPLDTCISCFLLDFVGDQNHGYSYDLEHLAHEYRVYEQYMAHWHSIGSIPILDVQYEDLIQDLETGSRRIIDFIGLQWDDACAMPHKTERSVSTLSSDQVRKPVYTSSKERWRNYEQHIGTLIEALGTGAD